MNAPSIFKIDNHKVNNALSPFAQTSGARSRGSNKLLQKDNFLKEIITANFLSTIDKAVIELQYLYGLRITEVIEIERYNIYPTGLIEINTKKTGEKRLVISVNFIDFWTKFGQPLLPLKNTYTRHYFYHLYKNLGFYSKFGNNNKKSVTHFFRHMLVLQLQNAGLEEKMISKFLAHRSLESLKYYTAHEQK